MATSTATANGDQRAALKAMDGKRPAVKIEIVVINRRWLITLDYFEPVWNAPCDREANDFDGRALTGRGNF